MNRSSTRLALALVCTLALAPSAFAQDDDKMLKPAEPDFTLVSLPSALRLPQWGSVFHLTHRFSLPLNHTDSGEVFSRLFGIDSIAVTGIEYRIGIVKNVQVGVHHSGDNRTWSFFGQAGLVRQDHGLPVDLSAFVAIDIPRVAVSGQPFKRRASPGAALIVSRTINDHAALYVEPIVASNVFNAFGPQPATDHSLLIGIGGRVRVRPTVYLVAEAAPRVAGFKGNTNHAAVGLEKRAGGHVFQLNLSNTQATLLSQLAEGGAPANNWHLGFNITRKFF